MPSGENRLTVVEYHQRTKHDFRAYARGPETIDWDAQPNGFRIFTGAALTQLPLQADHFALPFAALDTPAAVPVQPLNLASVALLLELSMALSAWKQYGAARWSLRCNPSSGNLHPTECYLIVGGIAGLASGVYHYRADEHGLELRCPLPTLEAGQPLLLVGLSSVHWREAWKYGERAFRYCQHDVGHAVAALAYGAAALGWRVHPHYALADEKLAALLGIDRDRDFSGAEREHPDLLIALGSELRADQLHSLVSLAEQGEWRGRANVLDSRHHYSWPVIDQVADASIRPDLPASGYSSVNVDPWPMPLPSRCDETAAALIRRRRSAQAFDGETVMALADFYRILDQTLPRAGHAPWDVLPWRPRVHLVLFVHKVAGLRPGLYCLPRHASALDELKSATRKEFVWQPVDGKPEHLPLYLLIAANAQRTAAQLSCQQDIAGASCFSLGMLAEFDEQVADCPWQYRELFWEAGAIGQVLYLEAEACLMRGTGIGCYFDDPVHNLLGLEDRRYQSLYHFTVGGAVNDSRIANLPPYNRK